MPIAASAISPRKQFRFAIVCDGIETAYIQKFKAPKIDIKSAKHGDGPFDINTASRISFGTAELDTLKPSESATYWWKDWLGLIINLSSGAMGLPETYKKNLLIVEYAADGTTVVEQTELVGCFPTEIDPSDLDKLGEGNAIDKIKLSVDRVGLQ